MTRDKDVRPLRRKKIMKRICPECNGVGSVPADPPMRGRKRCPTCNGKQWVEA